MLLDVHRRDVQRHQTSIRTALYLLQQCVGARGIAAQQMHGAVAFVRVQLLDKAARVVASLHRLTAPRNVASSKTSRVPDMQRR